ncbi:unnamed protein product [Lupinus luteus]|uniref:RNA methyltransferase n=1 Tax=Lupinus luteus TaxID=3873 RepID=A0AAV1XMQ6_LUPLU
MRNELLLMNNMYDIILCLNTTHLIELNLEGHNLVTFFRRLWYNLKPKGRLVLDPKSLRPYGSNFYDSEAETKAMHLNPNETIISRMVNILTEEFWRELVDVERYYRRIYQINSNGECLVHRNSAAREFLELTMIQGGILVLEPQSLESYVKKDHGSKTNTVDLYPKEPSSVKDQDIKVLPDMIRKIMLDKIGFKCVEQINSHGENRFNRPILVFQK